MKNFKLTHPIPYGDGDLAELQLRRPAAGELRGIRLRGLHDMDVDTVLTVASRIATPHVTIGQFAALDPVDLLRLTEEVTDFFTG